MPGRDDANHRNLIPKGFTLRADTRVSVVAELIESKDDVHSAQRRAYRVNTANAFNEFEYNRHARTRETAEFRRRRELNSRRLEIVKR